MAQIITSRLRLFNQSNNQMTKWWPLIYYLLPDITGCWILFFLGQWSPDWEGNFQILFSSIPAYSSVRNTWVFSLPIRHLYQDGSLGSYFSTVWPCSHPQFNWAVSFPAPQPLAKEANEIVSFQSINQALLSFQLLPMRCLPPVGSDKIYAHRTKREQNK